MKNIFLFLFVIVVQLFEPQLVKSQLSFGGKPEAIDIKQIKPVQIPDSLLPDRDFLLKQDEERVKAGNPERMGIVIPADFTTENSGEWFVANGRRIWRLRINLPGAVGVGLYFKNFKLVNDSRIFVYSSDKQHVIGAFTERNNHSSGLFATEVVKGDNIFIEYSVPVSSTSSGDFVISGLLFVYRPMPFPGQKTTSEFKTGPCQVNTICSEGDNWRDEIKSVVKILIKSGSASYWCTGSLINNTASDFAPYLLTADHCARNGSGTYASPEDVMQWIFYFRYESSECESVVIPPSKTLTGAVKVASSSPLLNNGSDFYLVLLKDDVPPSFEPYYAGWDKSGALSNSGVGIHHPSGDVKKISTFTTPLVNDQWGSNPGTHFRVVWSATTHGHGTTEGGSSGSPIFNESGRIIGQLTGGESGCYSLTGPDFYGKIAYSWNSNGSADSVKLQPWLDPIGLGVNALNGAYNDKQAIARFKADTTIVAVGQSLSFTDLSSGNPVSWSWHFEGGEPEFSSAADPGKINYNRIGRYNVSLRVSNEFGNDSISREDYIYVVPRVFPNPATVEFYVMTGNNNEENCKIEVYDATGRLVYSKNLKQTAGGFAKIDCTHWKSGFYGVDVKCSSFGYSAKLFVAKP